MEYQNKLREHWEIGKGWGKDKFEAYAQILYKRAIGELPEMESGKAVAKIVSKWIKPDGSLLDAGCGAGHYLRSLKNNITVNFHYTGIDNSVLYIKLARKAFDNDALARFMKLDIYHLPFVGRSFDIVMSNNVFLHLPSIASPLRQLCRVARHYVLLRTLVGDCSFRIQEVRLQGDEFKLNGSPKSFNFYNIYSKAYFAHLISKIPRVKKWEICTDIDFNPRSISGDIEKGLLHNATKMLGPWQVNRYILQPWAFIKIYLR